MNPQFAIGMRVLVARTRHGSVWATITMIDTIHRLLKVQWYDEEKECFAEKTIQFDEVLENKGKIKLV